MEFAPPYLRRFGLSAMIRRDVSALRGGETALRNGSRKRRGKRMILPRTSSRRRPHRVVLRALLMISVLSVVAGGFQAHAADPPGAFRAGAATSNISPWLGLSINGNMRDVKVAYVHD